MARGYRHCDLSDGYWRLPPGKLVTATTWMEMSRRPSADSTPRLRLELVPARSTPELRETFNRVGAPSMWDKTVELNAGESDAVWDEDSTLYYAYDSDRHVGLLELVECGVDERVIEIEYLGLLPELTGRGLGKRLMAAALDEAWSRDPKRVQLHTCHFDHPSALPFYIACGFTPVAFGFQIMDDPRLLGHLPRGVAPQVPLIES